jgi:hypothetical protein
LSGVDAGETHQNAVTLWRAAGQVEYANLVGAIVGVADYRAPVPDHEFETAEALAGAPFPAPDLRQEPSPVLLVDTASEGWAEALPQAGDVGSFVAQVESGRFDFHLGGSRRRRARMLTRSPRVQSVAYASKPGPDECRAALVEAPEHLVPRAEPIPVEGPLELV